MPVRSMTLTTRGAYKLVEEGVSDACQINDFDHDGNAVSFSYQVSDACQINDFDHGAC